METHDSHFITLQADDEGIWVEIETDTGGRAENCLSWQRFHDAYQAWLSSHSEKNELEELEDELRRSGLG